MKTRSFIPYCAPFALFLLFIGLIDLLRKQGLEAAPYFVFPLQTVACGALVLFFWKRYNFQIPRGIGFTMLAALAAFGLWIAPQVLHWSAPRTDGFNPETFPPGSAAYWITLGFRFLRLVVVVPLVEEIFWRGFLLRYLIEEDFESVPLGKFTGLSFGVVSLFFMLEHQPADYPAALICSALFNLVAIRTRSLSACVLAHAITNLALGVYIMATRQWGFW